MPDSGRRQFAIYGYCLFCGRRRLILFPDLSYSSLQFSVKKVIASFGVTQLNIRREKVAIRAANNMSGGRREGRALFCDAVYVRVSLLWRQFFIPPPLSVPATAAAAAALHAHQLHPQGEIYYQSHCVCVRRFSPLVFVRSSVRCGRSFTCL